jgi:hypothetical protein
VPIFGVLALLKGYLSNSQLDLLLSSPPVAHGDDGSVHLANLSLKRGFLTPVQIQEILLFQHYREQRAEDESLGALAVKRGLVDEGLVQDALEAQHRHFIEERQLPKRLGPVLLEADALTAPQLEVLRAEHESSRKLQAWAPAPEEAAIPIWSMVTDPPSNQVITSADEPRPQTQVFPADRNPANRNPATPKPRGAKPLNGIPDPNNRKSP